MRKTFVVALGLAGVTATAAPAFARSEVPAGVTGGVGTGSGMGTGATSGVTRGGAVTGATPGVTRRDDSSETTQTGLPSRLPTTPETPTTIDRQTGLTTAPSTSPATRVPEDPREALSPRVRARQSGGDTGTPSSTPPSVNVPAPSGARPAR